MKKNHKKRNMPNLIGQPNLIPFTQEKKAIEKLLGPTKKYHVYALIQKIGLAGMLVGAVGSFYDYRNIDAPDRTPAMERMHKIEKELTNMNFYGMSRNSQLEDKCTALIRDYHTIKSKPETIQQIKKYNEELDASNSRKGKFGSSAYFGIFSGILCFVGNIFAERQLLRDLEEYKKLMD